ncbi:MAG: matrixin family metalloprotease, partial [Fuerstiella sp.]|nr:matrixin family metalloprotease [Fuerstiella sp.]
VALQDLTIPADTVVVYVGGRDLPAGLGEGGLGGFQSSGSPAFNDTLQTRGESGVDTQGMNDTDFSLWGGAISFDSRITWNFSLNPPSVGQNDFFSVALHEMGHVLGLGTADSYRNQINGSNQFTGTEAVAAFGGPVPMNSDSFGNPDSGHWASNTLSTLPGTTTIQEAAMDPDVTTGSRKLLTILDWAGLDDLG